MKLMESMSSFSSQHGVRETTMNMGIIAVLKRYISFMMKDIIVWLGMEMGLDTNEVN